MIDIDRTEVGKRAVYATLGARNYAQQDRQVDDFYATDPKALELLLEQEKFDNNVWECACGQGHLSEVLVKHGYNVRHINKKYSNCSYNLKNRSGNADEVFITNY